MVEYRSYTPLQFNPRRISGAPTGSALRQLSEAPAVET